MRASPDDESQYEPGVCNIGTGERNRRRLSGHVGFLLGTAFLVAVIVFSAPPRTAILSGGFFSIGALGYLQARTGFCAYYGATGQYNTGPISADPIVVGEEESRARDRRRAILIASYSLGLGVALGLVGYLFVLVV